MPNFAQTIVIGHVGQDPEIRYMNSGDAVASFSVAYSEKWKAKDGTPQEKTEWYRVSVFGKTVTAFVEPYVKKGDVVMVKGKMWTRKWQDKEGNDRYSTELKADMFGGLELLHKKDGGGQQRAGGQQRQQKQESRKESPKQQEDFSDDIPF